MRLRTPLARALAVTAAAALATVLLPPAATAESDRFTNPGGHTVALDSAPASAVTPAKAKPPSWMIRGVDISHWNHMSTSDTMPVDKASSGGKVRGENLQPAAWKPIDWRRVSRDYRFMFRKATEGRAYKSPGFAADMRQARAAGMYVGAYHFMSAGDGTAQARHFVAQARTAGYNARGVGQLPPVLDVEWTISGGCPRFTMAQVVAFLKYVKKAFGRTPIVYTQQSFVAQCFRNNPTMAKHALLWTVDWVRSKPRMAVGWSNWTFWQYGVGPVPGVHRKSVDQNVFRGSQKELAALANDR